MFSKLERDQVRMNLSKEIHEAEHATEAAPKAATEADTDDANGEAHDINKASNCDDKPLLPITTSKFTCFGKLAFEIRPMIWGYSCYHERNLGIWEYPTSIKLGTGGKTFRYTTNTLPPGMITICPVCLWDISRDMRLSLISLRNSSHMSRVESRRPEALCSWPWH